jgi:ubiquinone/menaquinone biosynthesis C-methylase UbiE
MLGRLHHHLIYRRRVRVLGERIAGLLPPSAQVLDVGCGDGAVATAVMTSRPDVKIHGIDVLVRTAARISVEPFDGASIPADDRSIDVVMLVDVLHHTNDPAALLREAARVARRAVVVKDHCAADAVDRATLRAMDWVGNARHGVALPYNYWSEAKWRRETVRLGLQPDVWEQKLDLYPRPLSLLFDRRLHFVARFVRVAVAQAA